MTVQGAQVGAYGMPIAQPLQAQHAASDNKIRVQRSEDNIFLCLHIAMYHDVEVRIILN